MLFGFQTLEEVKLHEINSPLDKMLTNSFESHNTKFVRKEMSQSPQIRGKRVELVVVVQ